MAHEDRIVSELPCREARKQPKSFLRQHDVTRLPCLALAYRDDAGIGAIVICVDEKPSIQALERAQGVSEAAEWQGSDRT